MHQKSSWRAQEREVPRFNRKDTGLLERQKHNIVTMDGAEGFNDLQELPDDFTEYGISFAHSNADNFITDQDEVTQRQPIPITSSPSYYLPLELSRPEGGFDASIPVAGGSKLANTSFQHGTQLYQQSTSHRRPIDIPDHERQVVNISNAQSAIQDPSSYNDFVTQGSSSGGFVDDGTAFGSATTLGFNTSHLTHHYPSPINGQFFMDATQGLMGPAEPPEYGFGGRLATGSPMSTHLPPQSVYPALPWSSTRTIGNHYTYPPPETAQECTPAYGPGSIGAYGDMTDQGRVQYSPQNHFRNDPAPSIVPWNGYVQQPGATNAGASKQNLAIGVAAHIRTRARATGKGRARVVSGTDDDRRAGTVEEANEPVEDDDHDGVPMEHRRTAPSTVDNSRDGRKESHMTRNPSKIYTKPLTPATSWNHINVKGKYNYFTYTSRGVLDPTMFLGAAELKNYIDHCPRKPRIWVQHVPAQCNIRQGAGLQCCRFNKCPANKNKMPVGFDRVVFDEFWKETSSGQRDPFLVAFTMHLWCFEQCRDLLEDHLSGKLKPETRTFPKEDRNKMDLSRDSDKQIIPLTYDLWFGSRSFVTKPRKHKYTLAYALNQHHVRNQNRTRQKTRDKRNDKKEAKHRKTIDIHKGHLLYQHKKDSLTDASIEARYAQRMEMIEEFQPKWVAEPNPEEEVDLNIEPEQEVNVALDGPDPPLVPRSVFKTRGPSSKRDNTGAKDDRQPQAKGGVEDVNAAQGDEGVVCDGPHNIDVPEDDGDSDVVIVATASNSNTRTGIRENQVQQKDSEDTLDRSIQRIMTPRPSPSPRSTGSNGSQRRPRTPAGHGHACTSPTVEREDIIDWKPRQVKRSREESPETSETGRASCRRKRANEVGAQLVSPRRSPRQQQGQQ
jgi:hypothetical protein